MRHAEQTIGKSGRAFTRIRRHVYELLLDAEMPLGAYDIMEKLEGVGCAQPATAYRALYFLENLGLIRKIKTVSKYVPIARPHPEASIAFVVCKECGAAEQVTLDLDNQRLLARAQACGFQTLDLMIEFTGYCSDHQTSEFS
ncbi:Fur family transcriptional regulator [Hyphomonas sp.]|uniref:Fur family transcriptional regulator n=1 Tax=Hyphomonas sp. TaxID=87 RepID=UPI0025C58F39|nr:transcriptional repressor [Hyphomonas sp.]